MHSEPFRRVRTCFRLSKSTLLPKCHDKWTNRWPNILVLGIWALSFDASRYQTNISRQIFEQTNGSCARNSLVYAARDNIHTHTHEVSYAWKIDFWFLLDDKVVVGSDSTHTRTHNLSEEVISGGVYYAIYIILTIFLTEMSFHLIWSSHSCAPVGYISKLNHIFNTNFRTRQN